MGLFVLQLEMYVISERPYLNGSAVFKSNFGRGLPIFGESLVGGVIPMQNLRRIPVEDLALLAERHFAAGPFKKSGAQLLFQFGYIEAYRRL